MFFVNFGTGAGNGNFATLEAAKQYADANAAYTQNNINIYNGKNEIVALRRWYGYAYNDENEYSDDPICFGDFGFYDDWKEL